MIPHPVANHTHEYYRALTAHLRAVLVRLDDRLETALRECRTDVAAELLAEMERVRKRLHEVENKR